MENIIISNVPSYAHSSVRSSLACAHCRSRHVRCDARTPCSRCQAKGENCVYQKSRRGGRRIRKPTQSEIDHPSSTPSKFLPADFSSSSPIQDSYRTSNPIDSSPNPNSLAPVTLDRIASSGNSSSITTDQNVRVVVEASTFQDDTEDLLDSYYTQFHPAHPCALPRLFFKQRLETDSLSLKPVLIVMKYIGSLYMSSATSASLEALVLETLAEGRVATNLSTGYHVQSLILYSIAVYWCSETHRGLSLLNEAISNAIDLGMNLQGFAVEHGHGDPVLEESWRRTWWLIHVTDAHFAGSTHTYPMKTTEVFMDVDLPCEEESYVSGNIPQTRTLFEYDMREFAEDDGNEFSSFAQLIGLTRSLNTVFSCGLQSDPVFASTLAANFDASIMGWSSLLLQSKRRLLRFDGTLDELLFRANMLVNTYIVGIHRPLSNLAYCSVESVSRCAPPPPMRTISDDVAVSEFHTSKILQGIEALNGLLILSTSLKAHTPFVICMIANATIAYLSACSHVLRDQALKLAREKIRLHMAVIKALGECWPLAREIYRQVGVVAREILGLVDTVLPVRDLSHNAPYCDSPMIFNLDSSFDQNNFEELESMSLYGGTF